MNVSHSGVSALHFRCRVVSALEIKSMAPYLRLPFYIIEQQNKEDLISILNLFLKFYFRMPHLELTNHNDLMHNTVSYN